MQSTLRIVKQRSIQRVNSALFGQINCHTLTHAAPHSLVTSTSRPAGHQGRCAKCLTTAAAAADAAAAWLPASVDRSHAVSTDWQTRPPSLPTTARSRDNHFHDYALGLYERYKSTHSLTHSLAHFKLSPRLPRSPITTTSVYRLSFLQKSSCQALRASAERSAALVATVTTTEVLPTIQPEATAVEIIARASLENNLNVLPFYGWPHICTQLAI